MKRFWWVVAAIAVVAVAAWYIVRIAQMPPGAGVSGLLPRETVLLLHVQDFHRTRDRWHQSDLCQLYREPVVQDFLHKPLSRIPEKNDASETLREIDQLGAKDGFFALTRVDQRTLTFVAGFHFRGSEQDAERHVGKWRAKLLEKNPGAKRETLEYERHKIDTIALEPFVLASAYDGQWFFAANDLAELKALLDRADRRSKDREATLETGEAYRAAMTHMPSTYAALLYLQPRTFAQQLQKLRAAVGSAIASEQSTLIEQIRSVCGTTRFDGGKIHDTIFVGMPRIEQVPALTRSSLALGTKNTFLYLAMLLNLGEKIDILSQAPGLGDRLQKLFQAFVESGIKADDWKMAFGLELGGLADWPENTRSPSFLLTLPVIDSAKASRIVEAAMRIDEDSSWARSEKEGVRYFSMQSPATLIAIKPTIALSERILVAGLDSSSVEDAVKRSRDSTSELSGKETYKAAARSVPPPTNFFAYLDTAMLYTRLDATIRPLLLMAAAFMPGVNDYVDLGKFPATEVITKHLSPIVSSQRYDHDGYVTESVGPVTLNQATIGLAAIAIGIANGAKDRHGLLGTTKMMVPTPTPSATP